MHKITGSSHKKQGVTAYGEETQVTRGIRRALYYIFRFFGPGECAGLPFEQIFVTALIRKCHHSCVALKALRHNISFGGAAGGVMTMTNVLVGFSALPVITLFKSRGLVC